MTKGHLSRLDTALLGLRSLILGGSFSKGQRLSEVALAKKLEISRTPLRQAMDRLVAEGLLERIQTRGCRVATFTKDDIADAIEVRGMIEGAAARLAAERGVTADLLAQAEDALDKIDTALNGTCDLDFAQYVKQNARFYDLLARFPASQIVQREIERISLLPLASPSAFLSDQAMIPDFQDSLRYAQRQHRAILDAIFNGEGTRAEAPTREHARLALVNFNYFNEVEPKLVNEVPGLMLVAPT
ncbi:MULTISPECIES: GntR family transcriptional regulator [Falsihalocynthiibacter]|uniref:GntR family transcriptional regulator n=1 Tax=Falsihalocynthiibacter TaxID=2854182 RepID=UPI0030022BF1